MVGASAFIERLYVNVLGRASDPTGLAFWLNDIQLRTASAVATDFYNSPEYSNQNHSDTEFIQSAYQTFLDRSYDLDGLNDWLKQLEQGLSRDNLLDAFAQSQEFFDIAQGYGIVAYSAGSDQSYSALESFVSRFYTEVLDRAPDAEGLSIWVSALEGGSAAANDIAKGFFSSKEFINKNTSDGQFIDYAYQALLGRAADSEGRAHWLAEFDKGLARDTLLQGFIHSTEFASLADGYGIAVTKVDSIVDSNIVDPAPSWSAIVGHYELISFELTEVDGSLFDIGISGSLDIFDSGYTSASFSGPGLSEFVESQIISINEDEIQLYSALYDEYESIIYNFDGQILTFTELDYSGTLVTDWLMQ